MGGFTTIQLKDASQENIDLQNNRLKSFGVGPIYRFYSEKDIRKEYEAFKNGIGTFPEHLFPKTIKSYEDFKRYWSPSALGEVFCPHIGMLTFDCYFGRTSTRQMKLLRKYLMDIDTPKLIKKVDGSFGTFVERACFTKLEKQILKDYNIFGN